MKIKLLIILTLTAILIPSAFGYEHPQEGSYRPIHKEYNVPPRPNSKEIRELDKLIEERLKLTPEQIKLLRAHRQKNVAELKKTITKMEENHKKIRNIYMLGLPAYQSDIKSAPYKLELVILKQNADKIRTQNRKYFESILTPEQKIEFKKLRSELPRKKV